MNLYWLFYLFSVADRLNTLFKALVIISTIGLVVLSLVLLFTDDYSKYKSRGEGTLEGWFANTLFWQRSLLFLCPIFWLLFIGTPTRKEAVLIVTGGYIGSFIQSDSNARALPADITRFLRVQIQQAAREAELGDLLGNATQAKKDSLLALPKEQLVKQLLESK
ncbi:hypothetical protein CLV58_11916 [Spirosoma oryzae]|uniref:Uncharacterized protein n=1 Tax=Spirosoma oryzae TaxID=1469603 RepID=A0A2T0SKC4_9BACT|nr:hypothetical protein [Spirosoma oryzae]PRY33867.1 hypothetical protein CLV58_11916 [Spirosoma oryzae]